MRRQTYYLKVKVEVMMPDEMDDNDVINEIDYKFSDIPDSGVIVTDTEIVDYELVHK